MKYIAALFAVIASSVFAESPEVDITAAQFSHRGYNFSVVATPVAPLGKGSEIQRIVLAIVPPLKAMAAQEGYVQVRKEKNFVFSSRLGACGPNDFPISLRHQVPRDAILFTFNISLDALPESWFTYQLPRTNDGLDPVNCVVRLANFLQAPSQPPKPPPQ